jgi:hypothetical protein
VTLPLSSLLLLAAGCGRNDPEFTTPYGSGSDGGDDSSPPPADLEQAPDLERLLAQLQVAGGAAAEVALLTYQEGDADCPGALSRSGDTWSGELYEDCETEVDGEPLEVRGAWALSLTDGCEVGPASLSLNAEAIVEGTLAGHSSDTSLSLRYDYEWESGRGWWAWDGGLSPSSLPLPEGDERLDLLQGQIFQAEDLRFERASDGDRYSGTFGLQGDGLVSVETTSPLTWEAEDCAWPDSGELALTGAAEATVSFGPGCTEPSWSRDGEQMGAIGLSFYPFAPLCL